MTHRGSLTGSSIILNQQIPDTYNRVCMRLIRSHHRSVLGNTSEARMWDIRMLFYWYVYLATQ